MKYQTVAKRVSASLRKQGLVTVLRDYPTGLSRVIDEPFMTIEVRDRGLNHLGFVYVYGKTNQVEVDQSADPALSELVRPL